MMLILSAFLVLQSPPAVPDHRVATLSCGTGRFVLESEIWQAQEAPRAPRSQKLAVIVNRRLRSVAIERSGMKTAVGSFVVAPAYVSSWACVRARSRAHYVLLGYACAEDADCGGDREWFRLVDEHGGTPGASLPRQGSSWNRLLARSGLRRVLEEGVAMKTVLEDSTPAQGSR